MSDRATCWSITINNPTEEELKCEMPGWKLEGQLEQGESGTIHFQGMLTTTQQRFGAIKRQFPRAHIEVAKDRRALAKYVHKDETRVAEYDTQTGITIFRAQANVAAAWDHKTWEDWKEFNNERGLQRKDLGDVALEYVDEIVGRMIRDGVKGIEFIAINPMWRSSWKKFYADIITRHAIQGPPRQTIPEGNNGGGGAQDV